MNALFKLFGIIGARGLAGLGALVFSIAISRTAGVETLGSVTFILSVASLLSLIGRFGVDVCIIKANSEALAQGAVAKIKPTLVYAAWLNGKVSLIIVIISALLLAIASSFDFYRIETSDLIILGVIPLTLIALISGYSRGVRLVVVSGALDIGLVLLIVAILIGAILYLGIEISEDVITACFLAVCWGVGIVSLIWGLRHATGLTGSAAQVLVDPKTFQSGHLYFMLIALATFTTQAGAFVVVGPVLTEAEIGLARGAERLALLVSFPLTAVNVLISPQIVHENTVGTVASMRALMFKACAASTALALPTTVALIAFPGALLSLFGPGFDAAIGTLIILTITQAVTAATGPFAVLLGLAGHERRLSIILLISLGLCVIFYPIGGYFGGITGFALAYLAVNVLKSLLLVVFGWRLIKEA